MQQLHFIMHFFFIFSALWSAAAPLYTKGLSRPSKKALVEVTAKRATRDLAIKMANLKVWQSCHGCQKIQKKNDYGEDVWFFKSFYSFWRLLTALESLSCIFYYENVDFSYLRKIAPFFRFFFSLCTSYLPKYIVPILLTGEGYILALRH